MAVLPINFFLDKNRLLLDFSHNRHSSIDNVFVRQRRRYNYFDKWDEGWRIYLWDTEVRSDDDTVGDGDGTILLPGGPQCTSTQSTNLQISALILANSN